MMSRADNSESRGTGLEVNTGHRRPLAQFDTAMGGTGPPRWGCLRRGEQLPSRAPLDGPGVGMYTDVHSLAPARSARIFRPCPARAKAVAMGDRTEDDLQRTGDNLRRLMADQGLTIDQLSQQSAVDRRTIKGVLDGAKRAQARTIGRLARGLGVASGEFFVDPARLLYRRFDQDTNPVVLAVIEAHPEVFADWTDFDFDELHSRVGTGGPLTAEGALTAAGEMNAKRELHEKLTVLLESSQAEVIAGIVELMYEKVMQD